MRHLQFNLRGLLLAAFISAIVAVPIGYLVRLPTQVHVTGNITFNGAPLSGAQVWWCNKDGAKQGCSTDASGGYVISLFPGSYTVAVTKRISTGPMRDAHSGALIDTTKTWMGAVVQPSRSLIPERYEDMRTSGLVADVRMANANTFTFQLAPQ